MEGDVSIHYRFSLYYYLQGMDEFEIESVTTGFSTYTELDGEVRPEVGSLKEEYGNRSIAGTVYDEHKKSSSSLHCIRRYAYHTDDSRCNHWSISSRA